MKKKELKATIERLEKELREVVLFPSSEASLVIKHRISLKDSLEKCRWMGSDFAKDPSKSVFTGFYSLPLTERKS